MRTSTFTQVLIILLASMVSAAPAAEAADRSSLAARKAPAVYNVAPVLHKTLNTPSAGPSKNYGNAFVNHGDPECTELLCTPGTKGCSNDDCGKCVEGDIVAGTQTHHCSN